MSTVMNRFALLVRNCCRYSAAASPLVWAARPSLWLAIICLTASSGCGSSAPPGRVTTAGTVSVAGEPIPDGEIRFEAITDGLGGGSTQIGSGGRFSLFLRPGSYRVGIVSVEGGVSPAGVSGADPVKLRVPARYANPASSGLEYTIDAANRRLSIDLPK
jgi:hypothetical protein